MPSESPHTLEPRCVEASAPPPHRSVQKSHTRPTPARPPFVRNRAPRSRQSYTAAGSGREFTSSDLKSFGRSTQERLRNALAKDVFTAWELAITRFGQIVSVTLFASEGTLATLRQFPPHGCDVRRISRLEAVQIVARNQTLDGMVLLKSVLGPHVQG